MLKALPGLTPQPAGNKYSGTGMAAESSLTKEKENDCWGGGIYMSHKGTCKANDDVSMQP